MPKSVEDCVEKLMADPEFTPKDPKQDKKEAAWAVCQAAHEKSNQSLLGEGVQLSTKLKGHGPTLVGAALTNVPFVVGMPEVSLNEQGVMVIPLLTKSKWQHPQHGVLDFNDEFMGYLIKNYHDGVVRRKLIVNAGHEPDKGAYGLFQEVQREGDLLTVLADPTPLGKQAVTDRVYLYASAELVFDYQGREIRMSTADLKPYDEAAAGIELAEQAKKLYLEEAAMPENDIQGAAATVNLEEVKALHDSEIAKLTERLVAQEGYIAQLKEQAWRAEIGAILVQAQTYKDSAGRAHAPVLLALCEKALLGEPLKDGTVKLSETEARDYVAAFVRILLTEMPGTMPATPALEGTPSPTSERHEDAGPSEYQKQLVNMVGPAKEAAK